MKQINSLPSSSGKIKSFMKDVFGISFSTGAWSQAQWQVTPMLTRAHQSIHNAVCRDPVLHVDETRHQRNTEKRWMWLATSQRFAYFMTHHSRGKGAAKRLLKNHDHNAVVVSDQYAISAVIQREPYPDIFSTEVAM